MKRIPLALVALFTLLAVAPGFAGDKTAVSTKPISIDSRFTLVRTLNAEFVFVKKPFPMGEKGLVIRNGEVSPDDRTLVSWSANKGAAARTGDKAQISNIEFRDNKIIFEINGGPKKKAKWYQRIRVSSMGGETAVANQPDPNATGSYVELAFDKFVPDLTVDQVKAMLAPVFQFGAGKSATNQYMESLPPQVQAALKNHEPLVGMSRELVIEAKGRPYQKIREKEGDVEYEEWLYGMPPADVYFVRFVGDEVSQIKVMKQDGTKIVRTEREMPAAGMPGALAQSAPAAAPATKPAERPSLRRPGEAPTPQTETVGSPAPVMLPPVDSGPKLPDGSTPNENPGSPPR
jgi:hypothetical protein